MSIEANRRRFLAFATLFLTAGARRSALAQGAGDYDTADPVERRRSLQERAPPPEGVPADPGERIVKDVGSWRIVSQYNNSEATIRADRIKVSSGGIKSFTPGGGGMQVAIPSIRTLNEQGDAIGTTDGAKTTGETGNEILIGGRGELKLGYAPQGRAYSGTLRLSTTSNMQSGFTASIALDGKTIRTVKVSDTIDLDANELFGPDLSALRAAKTLVVTVDGNSPYTIYAVDLVDTDAALKQMQLIPDYNYYVRRLGRKSEIEEFQEQQQPQSPGQCFLTTACCGIVGLADDCFELSALRRFRDQVMLVSEDGRRDVTLYYASAPAILEAMRDYGETGRLLGLYFTTILPCAIFIRLGLKRMPRRLYTRMMEKLAARYLSSAQGLRPVANGNTGPGDNENRRCAVVDGRAS